MLNDLMFIVEETVKAGGEVATGVTNEVRGLTDNYAASNPSSEATQQQQENAAYYALSVDNTEKYPPKDEEMKEQVEARQAYESVDGAWAERSGEKYEQTPEQKQQQMEDRMQDYLERQKQQQMAM